VPRPSKKEEKIRKFLLDFAKENNLSSKTDDIGNVLISKPASPGKENAPTVILQTHMDMVCEKNSDKVFDFENDPIEPVVTDGWVKSKRNHTGSRLRYWNRRTNGRSNLKFDQSRTGGMFNHSG
jgi:dipeptidase D